METKFKWTRIDNDISGNPRYVVHFINLLTEAEKNTDDLSGKYNIAVKRANKIGGRKFHNKKYGGGIVFSSNNISMDEKHIISVINEQTHRNEVDASLKTEYIVNLLQIEYDKDTTVKGKKAYRRGIKELYEQSVSLEIPYCSEQAAYLKFLAATK